MKYFTSDTHFGHANIIKYSNRPYTTVEEMNEALIENWNATVSRSDEIYHLGDFAFMQEKELASVLRRLNGNKFLIWGNHDEVLKKSKDLQRSFNWCRDYHELKLTDGVDTIHTVLCHYAFLVWNKSHRGSLMLHGHSHGMLKYPYPMRMMDVGVDPCGYRPISEIEIVQRLKAIPAPTFANGD